jgi:DNA-binding transcriptional MocR family regulator
MSPQPSKIDFVIESILMKLRAGALRPGQRLPSIRDEAQLFGVGKNTVVEAYLRLVGQGILRAKPGSGYYVVRAPEASGHAAAVSQDVATDRVSLLAEQLDRRLPIRPGDGRPPSEWLETSELRRYLGYQRFQEGDAYNSSWGHAPLRSRLCGALAERGIACRDDQLFMTHGANHAMDLVIRRHVAAGDAVLVDDPGYYPLLAKLALAGANTIGVNRLHDGPDIADLEAKARKSGARLFFTQSLAHNPTGGSLSLGAAYSVLRIATEFDMLVVEDDPFADILPYTAPRLAALDQLDRVIYIGTFSKTLAGSLRSGYVAAAPKLAAELNELKIITTVSTSAHDERLVFQLIEHGHYLKHLRRLRARASNATAESVAALESCGFSIRRPIGGGFYLWIDLPEHMAGEDLLHDAAKHGIFIAPAITFSTSKTPKPAMRINVAYGSDPVFVSWLREKASGG